MDIDGKKLYSIILQKAHGMPKPKTWKNMDTPCPMCGQKTIFCCIAVEYPSETRYRCHVCINSNCNHGEYKSSFNRPENDSCDFCARDNYVRGNIHNRIILQNRGTLVQKISKRLKKILGIKVPQLPMPERFKIISAPCPKCHGRIIACCHAEIGATDYYDEFLHICLNPKCDYKEHKSQYTGLGQESPSDHLCPFCGRNVYIKNIQI